VYNGQVLKGIILALLYAASLLLIISGSPMGYFAAAVLLIYGASNAYRVADRYEHWIGGPQMRCLHCGESIQATAVSCRFCGWTSRRVE